MANDIFNLSGKKALITGGSKGIGLAASLGLAQAGAIPFIVCRNEKEGLLALDKIKSETGITGRVFKADLSSKEEALKLVNNVLNEIGTIDILVHSAGTNVVESLTELKDESWDHIMQLNLNAAMSLVRGFAPSMKNNKWGRIILISSIMGIASREERAAYSASKSGLIGFMKSAALELGEFGITVNCLAPGPIETELTANLISSEVGIEYASRLAVKRWGKVEELIGPILLLASDAGSFITGTSLIVDGGALECVRVIM